MTEEECVITVYTLSNLIDALSTADACLPTGAVLEDALEMFEELAMKKDAYDPLVHEYLDVCYFAVADFRAVGDRAIESLVRDAEDLLKEN